MERTARVIWAAMLVGVAIDWVVYRLVPGPVDESRFVLVAQVHRWLPVGAIVLTIAAGWVYRTIPAGGPGAALPRYVVCWALAESIGVATLGIGIVFGVPGLDLFFAWAAALLLALRT